MTHSEELEVVGPVLKLPWHFYWLAAEAAMWQQYIGACDLVASICWGLWLGGINILWLVITKNQLADNRLYVVTHSARVIRTSAISREEAIDWSYAIYWLHVYQPNCGLSIENMRRIPMRIHWNYIALHSDENTSPMRLYCTNGLNGPLCGWSRWGEGDGGAVAKYTNLNCCILRLIHSVWMHQVW